MVPVLESRLGSSPVLGNPDQNQQLTAYKPPISPLVLVCFSKISVLGLDRPNTHQCMSSIKPLVGCQSNETLFFFFLIPNFLVALFFLSSHPLTNLSPLSCFFISFFLVVFSFFLSPLCFFSFSYIYFSSFISSCGYFFSLLLFSPFLFCFLFLLFLLTPLPLFFFFSFLLFLLALLPFFLFSIFLFPPCSSSFFFFLFFSYLLGLLVWSKKGVLRVCLFVTLVWNKKGVWRVFMFGNLIWHKKRV